MQCVIKILHGDVFSESADVAVLPCSTTGELKDFARRTIEDLALPLPPRHLALGSVQAVQIERTESGIRHLVYAAVRDERGSSTDVLRRASARVGDLLAGISEARVVAAPVLGSGAGGLRTIDCLAAIVEGFDSTAPPQSLLSLCAPRRKTFAEVRDWHRAWSATSRKDLRVFLSYNQRTQQRWVVTLHEFLRKQGFNAVMDRWNLRHSTNLKEWMAQEILRADRVLIVTDDEYARKADSLEGGVGEETVIIQQELMDRSPVGKYVIVVRSPEMATGMPTYLRGRLSIHTPNECTTAATHQRILAALYESDDEAPPISLRPLYVRP